MIAIRINTWVLFSSSEEYDTNMIDLIETLGTYFYDREIFHREEIEEPTTNTTTITTTLKEILSPLYNWRMS